MTSENLNSAFAEVYRELFDHTLPIRKEAEQFYNTFEGSKRHTEFDQLLRTSHVVNEALESDTATRIPPSKLDKFHSKLDAVAASLERIVKKDGEGEASGSDYVTAVRQGQQEQLEQFEEEIAASRRRVDEQMEKRLEDLKQQYEEQLEKYSSM